MFEPQPLNLPSYPFRLKKADGAVYIFDEVRKKFLVLSPEEWVRQHLVQFLILHKNYPRSLFRLEGGLKLHSMQKRSDIVIYNTAGEKILLAECKAPSIKISQQAFDQIARYNMVYRVPLLLVSNGINHYCCRIDFETSSYTFIEEIPPYSEVF